MFKELLGSLRKWHIGYRYSKAVRRMMPPGLGCAGGGRH